METTRTEIRVGNYLACERADPEPLFPLFEGRFFNDPREHDGRWGRTFEILYGRDVFDADEGLVWTDDDGEWVHIAVNNPVGKAAILNAVLAELGPRLRMSLAPADSAGLIRWVCRHLGFRPYGEYAGDVLLERVSDEVA